MPVRATKRGAERTPFPSGAEYDVVICGASFAGLAVARELRASRARVLVLDRYEIGEKQTSACCAPTDWIVNLGLEASIKQTFATMAMHTLGAHVRWQLPYTFSTFDYRQLCELMWEQCGDAEFETAMVEGKSHVAGGETIIHTDRGDVRARLVVDALGWRRVLSVTPSEPIQPPQARLSRGLEVHPHSRADDLELWLDRRYVRAGYSWSFPAGDEVRVGVGSFDPHDKVKEPTVELAGELGVEAVRYQGNWIPHRIRPAAEGDVFFAGDSAGHCLPTTAEGIRTALYFGLACGRELRAIVEGRSTRADALDRYGRFSASHRWKFEAMWHAQSLFSLINRSPRATTLMMRALTFQRFVDWSFGHYLKIAPPEFVSHGRPPTASGEREQLQRRSTPAGRAA
jgi:menaquinone-9 beta-reductase